MTSRNTQITTTLLITLLATALLSGCGTTALCQKTIDQAEECSGETATPEQQTEMMESCQEVFEDAEEIGPECYDGIMDLTECLVDLSCGELEEYWGGEPGTTGYPCAAQDEALFIDGVCD